jgi:hypothetical protein
MGIENQGRFYSPAYPKNFVPIISYMIRDYSVEWEKRPKLRCSRVRSTRGRYAPTYTSILGYFFQWRERNSGYF